MTEDAAFATRVAPVLAPHRAEFLTKTGGDPDGLWPVAGPYDNEALQDEHYTGHSFWALLGLKEGKRIAAAAGLGAIAADYQSTYDTYRTTFFEKLDSITALTGGYIPPGVDDPLSGYDWANASAGVYPFGEIAPSDPRVAETAWVVREHKYQEGIMTYGSSNAHVRKLAQERGETVPTGWLHHYQTIYTTMTNLLLGEQRRVVEDLYGLLVHTSSTHAGFEYGIQPWGNRDPRGNRPPHGWFAARYNELLRHMLLREEGSTLHLASALSPAWVKPGQTVAVRKGATYFGPISYEFTFHAGGGTLTMTPSFRTAPEAVVVHVPWFATGVTATADGAAVPISGGAIEVPSSTKTVDFQWSVDGAPDLSFDAAVEAYRHKYYDRPAREDYEFLFATPRAPTFATEQRIFLEKATIDLFVPGGLGTIHYTTDGSSPTTASPTFQAPFEITQNTTVKAIANYNGTLRGPVAAAF
ncbi:MAG: chitobiase/beta-hexosaminidase C-terminal domain-containing protein, partial [Myxococcales bacterium]|nr:chitobiase/beta-hexosaminidase C-terminal domain-containing protein [Myxococcales bacterium]